MKITSFCWLDNYPTREDALMSLLSISKKSLKNYLSKVELKKKIYKNDEEKLSLDLVNKYRINPWAKKKVEIIGFNKDFLVVHKDFNLHCFPQSYSDQETLLNQLVHQGFYEIEYIGFETYEKALLYRLDFVTSGVLVLARNKLVFENLRSNFKDAFFEKTYLAITRPNPLIAGQWSHHLTPTDKKGSRQKVSDKSTTQSQLAKLNIEIIFSNDEYQLNQITLKSGLRHQIRAQLSYLGSPIIGDELYGGEKASRVLLHALEYKWKYQDQTYFARSEICDLFKNFLNLHSLLKMSGNVFGTLDMG